MVSLTSITKKIFKRKKKRTSESSAAATKVAQKEEVVPTSISTSEDCNNFLLTDAEIEAAKTALVNHSHQAESSNNDHDESSHKEQQQDVTTDKLLKVVEEFYNHLNAHDTKSARSCVSKGDVQIQITNKAKNLDMELSWDEFAGSVDNMNASFPDFRLDYDPNLVVHNDSNDNNTSSSSGVTVVIVQGIRASGTHTGEPFGFGPFEPIPRTNKQVQNDPEELYYFFRKGESVAAKIIFCTKGEMTGPAGFYTQLGGFPVL